MLHALRHASNIHHENCRTENQDHALDNNRIISYFYFHCELAKNTRCLEKTKASNGYHVNVKREVSLLLRQFIGAALYCKLHQRFYNTTDIYQVFNSTFTFNVIDLENLDVFKVRLYYDLILYLSSCKLNLLYNC